MRKDITVEKLKLRGTKVKIKNKEFIHLRWILLNN